MACKALYLVRMALVRSKDKEGREKRYLAFFPCPRLKTYKNEYKCDDTTVCATHPIPSRYTQQKIITMLYLLQSRN